MKEKKDRYEMPGNQDDVTGILRAEDADSLDRMLRERPADGYREEAVKERVLSQFAKMGEKEENEGKESRAAEIRAEGGAAIPSGKTSGRREKVNLADRLFGTVLSRILVAAACLAVIAVIGIAVLSKTKKKTAPVDATEDEALQDEEFVKLTELLGITSAKKSFKNGYQKIGITKTAGGHSFTLTDVLCDSKVCWFEIETNIPVDRKDGWLNDPVESAYHLGATEPEEGRWSEYTSSASSLDIFRLADDSDRDVKSPKEAFDEYWNNSSYGKYIDSSGSYSFTEFARDGKIWIMAEVHGEGLNRCYFHLELNLYKYADDEDIKAEFFWKNDCDFRKVLYKPDAQAGNCLVKEVRIEPSALTVTAEVQEDRAPGPEDEYDSLGNFRLEYLIMADGSRIVARTYAKQAIIDDAVVETGEFADLGLFETERGNGNLYYTVKTYELFPNQDFNRASAEMVPMDEIAGVCINGVEIKLR